MARKGFSVKRTFDTGADTGAKHIFKKSNEHEKFKCKSMRLLGMLEEHPGEPCGWSEHGVRVVGGGK